MSEQKIDIAGTMAKAKPNWQARTELLSKPEYFDIIIMPSKELSNQLTPEEQDRLRTKLQLVAQYASYMAAGMVKGTVKYDGDNYSLDQWFAHLMGESADIANYISLLFHSYGQYKAVIGEQTFAKSLDGGS